MWATVLVLALITVTEPVRFGMIIFLISGPRPMLNLLAFWLAAWQRVSAPPWLC